MWRFRSYQSLARFSTKKTTVAVSADAPSSTTFPISSLLLKSNAEVLAHNLAISTAKNHPLKQLTSTSRIRSEDLDTYNLYTSHHFLFQDKKSKAVLDTLKLDSSSSSTPSVAALPEPTSPVELAGEEVVHVGSRNGRRPKKANHGARPCSHVARKSKRIKRHRGW